MTLFPRIRADLDAQVSAIRARGEEPDVAALYAEWCEKNYPLLTQESSGPAKDSAEAAAAEKAARDRRRHPRVPIRLNVFYRILWAPAMEAAGAERAKESLPESIASTAKGQNVSAGGLYIVADEEYPIATLVELEFDLPGLPEPTWAFAMITWSQRQPDGRWGLGLAFSHIEMPVRKALEETILERLLDAQTVSP